MSGLLVFVVVEHPPVAPVAQFGVFGLSVQKWYQIRRYSVDDIGFKGIETFEFGLGAKPGDLALGELPGGNEGPGSSVVKGAFAGDMSPELTIANGTHGRRIAIQRRTLM
jgi:hypothetical protein